MDNWVQLFSSIIDSTIFTDYIFYSKIFNWCWIWKTQTYEYGFTTIFDILSTIFVLYIHSFWSYIQNLCVNNNSNINCSALFPLFPSDYSYKSLVFCWREKILFILVLKFDRIGGAIQLSPIIKKHTVPSTVRRK